MSSALHPIGLLIALLGMIAGPVLALFAGPLQMEHLYEPVAAEIDIDKELGRRLRRFFEDTSQLRWVGASTAATYLGFTLAFPPLQVLFIELGFVFIIALCFHAVRALRWDARRQLAVYAMIVRVQRTRSLSFGAACRHLQRAHPQFEGRIMALLRSRARTLLRTRRDASEMRCIEHDALAALPMMDVFDSVAAQRQGWHYLGSGVEPIARLLASRRIDVQPAPSKTRRARMTDVSPHRDMTEP